MHAHIYIKGATLHICTQTVPALKAAIGSRRRLPPQAPRYIQGSSPSAPKATLGSVLCAYVHGSRSAIAWRACPATDPPARVNPPG